MGSTSPHATRPYLAVPIGWTFGRRHLVGSADMLAMPRSVVLASWASAWLADEADIDDVVRKVRGSDEPHDVSGMGTMSSAPLGDALLALRSGGATAMRVALPRPGDPTGLPGPADLTDAAVEAGEVALAVGMPYALVPRIESFGPPGDQGHFVTWEWWDADPLPPSAGLDEADRALRQTLLAAGDQLAHLDVPSWRPEVSQLLTDLRSGASAAPLPRSFPAKAQQVAARSARILAIAEFALADDGGAVTGEDADARRTAIGELESTARHALCAAAGALTE